MKKQSKNLKLNKSVVSEFNIKNADEIKGGITGAYFFCRTEWTCPGESVRTPC